MWPGAIASTFNDEVLVLDTFENRVIVFNKEFIFKYEIGTKGCLNGQFDEPSDLLVNELGKLCVADKNNYRVQIFSESKKLRETRFQMNPGSKTAPNTAKTTKSKMFKSGNEFSHLSSTILEDKPIKLASAPLNSILAVGTENGLVFILNEYFDVISYLKMRNPTLNDIRSICLTEMGDKLISFKHSKNEICIRFYNTESKNDEFYFRKGNKQATKMINVEKFLLEKSYLPGVCLAKIGFVKLSLEMNTFFIFDQLNSNLLEYDFEGRFKRIILNAENYLGMVTAFDFSSDRQHLLCLEAKIDRQKSLLDKRPSLQDENHLQKFRSRNFLFHIKSYIYRPCVCHFHKKSTKKKRSNSMENQSFNNFSIEIDDTIESNFFNLKRDKFF